MTTLLSSLRWEIVFLVLAPILYLASHEGGHFLTALVLGCKPTFGIERWHFIVSFTWDKPWKQRLISEAGFGTGMLVGLALLAFSGAPIFNLVYWLFLTAHFWIYPWTALADANDFEGMCARKE
jgi:hypothetical protein